MNGDAVFVIPPDTIVLIDEYGDVASIKVVTLGVDLVELGLATSETMPITFNPEQVVV